MPLLPDPKRPEPPRRQRDPEWESPPWGEIPATVATDVLHAASATAAARVTHVRINSTGCRFELAAVANDPDVVWYPGESPRFAIVWPDGKLVLPAEEILDWDEEPEGPLLVGWSTEYWLWPLPPPGRLTLVLDWPAQGLAEVTAELDTAILTDALPAVVHLWDDESPRS